MNQYTSLFCSAVVMLAAGGCATSNSGSYDASARIGQSFFGTTEAGDRVTEYSLDNANGMQVSIINYGGIVTRLTAPDRDGNFVDVVQGFDSLAAYEADSSFQGALIGRYGNRIAKGRFEIDGQTYQLATNDSGLEPPAHLHGGNLGYNKVFWEAEPVVKDGVEGLKLTYLSPDGEEGYPGNLSVTVHYWLKDANELEITYEASTDAPTHLNLTQHNYYNLKGEGRGTINDHLLTIHADYFTPVDKGLIPTGEIRPVAGTPFDFTKPQIIGSRVNEENEQLKYGIGYDHNWVLNNQDGDVELAASLYEPDSGRLMEVYTDQPGIQFYGGNFLDGTMVGQSGETYEYRGALCLETQHYPDSPNQTGFPSTLLKPGETFTSSTIYRFSAK